MDEQALSQARGEVIEKFINLEMLTNAIISQHYFGHLSGRFVFEVLYDEHCGFALRRALLTKSVPNIDNGQIAKLNRLNTIRNYFAHTGQQIVKPAGSKKELVAVVLDPRKLDKPIDFAKLHKEFQEIEPEVATYLFELFKELGGKYSETPPVT